MFIGRAPGGDRSRGRGLSRGGGGRGVSEHGGRGNSEYGRGRGRGGGEYGGGSERGGGPGGSEYGYGRGRGSPEAGRDRGRGYRGIPHGDADRGGPHGRGRRGRGRGVVVGASSPINEAPVVEVGPPAPREYGTAGKVIKLRSNHVEVQLDLKMLYQYDVIIRRRGRAEESQSITRNHEIIRTLQTEVEDRLTAHPGVYDGRKNLFTSFKLEFESDFHEYVVPMSTGSQVEGTPPAVEYTVLLSLVQTINPEVLQRFVRGQQSLDNDVLTAIMALNIVVRMEPCSMGNPFNARSFFTDKDTEPIVGGVVLWRGYFQSVRPAINRILINVNISTGAMYQHGDLIPLCLGFLRQSGELPQALTAGQLPERERRHLQNFLKGIKVTTPHRTSNPDRRRLVKRLTPESARNRTFEMGDGRTVTVMQYFNALLDAPLDYPDLICVELASGAVIPLELCKVPPGQLVRKEMLTDQIGPILEFSGLPPGVREKKICDGLNVLQSRYVREFGMHIPTSNQLVELDGRIITAPRLNYNRKSRQANIRPKYGKWNMLEKMMCEPVKVPNWLLIIYEGESRFNRQTARAMIRGFVEGCEAVGIKINPEPVLVSWKSGQGIIAHQLSLECNECQRKAEAAPSLIVTILPEGGDDIYASIKNFGDVTAGIPTQCMKAKKCFKANQQYFSNVALKVNMKLGGVNVKPDPRDVTWLNDPMNPTTVMGADMSHPSPGSRRGPGGYPSYTSLVGSINSTATKYVSTMGVQDSLQEVIEDLESMCMNVFEQYREAMEGKLPKRILFYRDGVSEGEFRIIIDKELKFIKNACARLNFNPKITLIVVTKKHKVVFFPRSHSDRDRDENGNCRPGTVIDTDVVSPAIDYVNSESRTARPRPRAGDYYLYGHAGILGTSKPAHYNVLVDENGFSPDGIQSLSYALCHLYARCTRSVSLPAPIFYAHNVCTRKKNHYDPNHVKRLFSPDMVEALAVDSHGGTPDQAMTTQGDRDGGGGGGIVSEFRGGFQQVHKRLAGLMYFL